MLACACVSFSSSQGPCLEGDGSHRKPNNLAVVLGEDENISVDWHVASARVPRPANAPQTLFGRDMRDDVDPMRSVQLVGPRQFDALSQTTLKVRRLIILSKHQFTDGHT